MVTSLNWKRVFPEPIYIPMNVVTFIFELTPNSTGNSVGVVGLGLHSHWLLNHNHEANLLVFVIRLHANVVQPPVWM